MKHILESEQVFEAYARIDYNNLLIKNIFKKISKPRSPLDILIDKAVGIEKEQIELLLNTLNEIISDKKLIESDHSAEDKLILKLKKVI